MQGTLIFSNRHAILKCSLFSTFTDETWGGSSSIFCCPWLERSGLEVVEDHSFWCVWVCTVSCVEILAHLPIAYMHLGLSFVLLHLVEKEYRGASQSRWQKYNREEWILSPLPLLLEMPSHFIVFDTESKVVSPFMAHFHWMTSKLQTILAK